ncbi:protein DGS1, mitochondrial isoform X1 [Durio zibethinus]|uniref:Protein DGS1, mitochondrial isoform X1 n=1 Tax=Durio zibethinus TaxID=66656 RepID=A0A6P5ZIZ5_DURZI|nr:protein DGS1, mitochondrial isoform X1 [Durio zibethinus]
MEATPGGNESSRDVKTLISFYSNFLWNRLSTLIRSSPSIFLQKISNLSRQTTLPISTTRRAGLPLPLPSNSFNFTPTTPEASRVYEVLNDIMDRSILNLHKIQNNLQFWQSRAEGSNARKVYFMIFERGPRAFVNGTVQLIHESVADGSAMQHLSHSASAYISERIAVLSALRCSVSTFLAEFYVEVYKCGEEFVNDSEKSFSSLMIILNGLFSKLEVSIGHLHALSQSDSSVDGTYSFPKLFEKLPEINQEKSQRTDCEISDVVNLVYKNLQELDSYLALMVAKHQKPRKLTRNWIQYTCGAVGLSVCSFWLLRHSRLMGSSDIDNWIREAKESTVSFFNDHVEQPLLSIRDELLDTFKKRQKGVMDMEEVQLTSNSLHRMLLAFSEQTNGKEFLESASDQEMLEIVMLRYEKELMHPIQNLLNGELARALLIQVQKLKLDIEMAMLELDQILRANEINFAILAALPAFFLSLGLVVVVRAWLRQDTRAAGRGRIARIQRRLLIVEVEKTIMQYQTYVDQGLENDAQCMFGMLIYCLDRLYHAVRRHAKATGEWQCLKQDIIDLGKPDLQTAYKLIVTTRMERVYDCLLPSLKRQ